MGLMTGAVQRTEGENMADLRSSSYTSSSQLSVSKNASSHLRDDVVSPVTLYSQRSSRPVIPLLGKHATIKSNRAHIGQLQYTEKAKRKMNKPSALGVHSRDQTFINSQHQISQPPGIGARGSWLRNYHLGEVAQGPASSCFSGEQKTLCNAAAMLQHVCDTRS